MPLFLFPDGSYLEAPPAEGAESFTELRAELAERVGLHVRPDQGAIRPPRRRGGSRRVDRRRLAASEGLDTMRRATCAWREAGTSSRIENFPGFPNGISGKELAEAIYAQALRFGAEIIVGADMVSAESARRHDRDHPRDRVSSRASRDRGTRCPLPKADAPGVEEFIGSGVYYGSAIGEAAFHRGGHVFVVGGATRRAKRLCTSLSTLRR